MKNQYFGDINDYRKYGLLRVLSDGGRNRIAVCWMLTESDKRSDGNKTGYLLAGKTHRNLDPELFDALHDSVIRRQRRHIQEVDSLRIVPSATYYADPASRDPIVRRDWLMRFLADANGHDIAFFDPDNGIEVKSSPKVHWRSTKHVYWDELMQTYGAGLSLLVYQHFPRRPHGAFVEEMGRTIASRVGASRVHNFRTSDVVFFLVPRIEHQDRLEPLAEAIKIKWSGQIW